MRALLKIVSGALVLFSSNALASTESGYEGNIIEQVISKYEQPVISENGINVSEEFSVIMMFDEVTTGGNFLWPEGYGNVEWSPNHYIFNESEQKLFSRNHATSPPNLLFVQDSSHTGGVEPYFKARPNSPAQSFDLHQISILPYTSIPRSPILFSIRGYPANGGPPLVRWYKWTIDAQLQYPWDAQVQGVDAVNKVEIFVVPGEDVKSKERLPYTLDNVKITWRTSLVVSNRAINAHVDGVADTDGLKDAEL
ncbi:hypothetical protein DFP73DRAFT_529713 [Morchella snyderi]|nr:hypothetical protein DFP73DRAFT_529713 [Morchella snyderi]